DEGAVDMLDDDGFARLLAGRRLVGKTGAIDCKAGVGRPAGVPNMKDRHLVVAERVEQADDVSKRVGVVALAAGSFPFIERNLDIDDNKTGSSLGKLVHNMISSAKRNRASLRDMAAGRVLLVRLARGLYHRRRDRQNFGQSGSPGQLS